MRILSYFDFHELYIRPFLTKSGDFFPIVLKTLLRARLQSARLTEKIRENNNSQKNCL